MIPFYTEDQLLSIEFRKMVIDQIVYSDENLERKAQELRKYEIYNDQNSKWVMLAIEKEGYKPETFAQMRNRASNISVCRKIVNKKAAIYNGGVDRKVGEPLKFPDGKTVPNPDQVSVDALADELDFNTYMKQANAYLELHKNCIVGCVPVLDSRETTQSGAPKYKLKMQVKSPWQYDVIPDPHDYTRPAVIILSEFPERIDLNTPDDIQDGIRGVRRAAGFNSSNADGIDQTIANSPEDRDQKEKDRRFIWWSDQYHFTTDIKGNFIGVKNPTDIFNPIRKNPWENLAAKQTDGFWARGGEDIVETSILVNKKMTDVNFIAFVQGWGQLVIDAEKVPKKLVGGPDNALIFERTVGGQPSTVYFATSNPPIEAWLETIRMTLALVLSTNNLSSRSVATRLDNANAASGISIMIENSEITSDLKDSQELFRDMEPCLWETVRLWHQLYASNNWLCKDQQAIETFNNSDVNLKFIESHLPVTEKERLEELKLRKELGIATLKDLIKSENPDLSDDEINSKIEEIIQEKGKMAAMVSNQIDTGLKNGDNQAPMAEEEE